MRIQADRVLLEHIRSRIARIQEYTGGNRARFYESNLAVEVDLPVLSAAIQRMEEVAYSPRCNTG